VNSERFSTSTESGETRHAMGWYTYFTSWHWGLGVWSAKQMPLPEKSESWGRSPKSPP